MSSRLWNIHRTTAFFLFTFTGYPESTAFFSTILSGLQLRREPAQTHLQLQHSKTDKPGDMYAYRCSQPVHVLTQMEFGHHATIVS